jgi:hypothetical protein
MGTWFPVYNEKAVRKVKSRDKIEILREKCCFSLLPNQLNNVPEMPNPSKAVLTTKYAK